MVCIDFEGAPKRKQTASSEMSDACTTALINMDTSVQRMSEAAVQLVCHFMSLESGSVTLSHTACVEPLSECSLMGVGGVGFARSVPCLPRAGQVQVASQVVPHLGPKGFPGSIQEEVSKQRRVLHICSFYACIFVLFWAGFGLIFSPTH